ncbi:MAG: hypothetical protein DCC49_04415 [Acidobacteria bacterium]|nr:MAG: hypothetical protein DCC49_04415 [Acidobacteriota bacterium]
MGDGLSGSLTLRPATEDDARFFFELRNEVGVREASFSSEPFSWEHHLDWFERRLASGDPIFVAQSGGENVGYVRLDSLGDDEYEVSVAVIPEVRGHGIGTSLIKQASEAAEAEGAIRLIARIRPGNDASMKAFEAAGYSGGLHHNGEEMFLARSAVK